MKNEITTLFVLTSAAILVGAFSRVDAIIAVLPATSAVIGIAMASIMTERPNTRTVTAATTLKK